MRKHIVTKMNYKPRPGRVLSDVTQVKPLQTPDGKPMSIAKQLERLQNGIPLNGVVSMDELRYYGDIGQFGFKPESLDLVDRFALIRKAKDVIEKGRIEHNKNVTQRREELKKKREEEQKERQQMKDFLSKQTQ